MGIHYTQLEKILRLGVTPEGAWIVEWIATLYNGPFQDVKVRYNHVPPHTWDMYEALGIHDQPEIKLLREARLYLTKIWRETYPWSKKQNVQSKTIESVSGGMSCDASLSNLQDTTKNQES